MTTKQNEFIVLRSNGITFDEIVNQLNVSKPTLIKWSKEFQVEIQDLKFEAMVLLKEKFNNNQQNNYEQLLKQLEKVNDAILEIDLSKTSLKDLIMVQKIILERIQIVEKSVSMKKTDVIECGLDFDTTFEKELPLFLDEV